MIKEKLNRIDEQIDSLQKSQNRLYKIKEAVKKRCKHEETYEDSEYNSGSYLDRASTTYYTKCSICGLSISHRTEDHDWYGM